MILTSMCLLSIIVLSIITFSTQISERRRYFPSEISVNMGNDVSFCHKKTPVQFVVQRGQTCPNIVSLYIPLALSIVNRTTSFFL